MVGHAHAGVGSVWCVCAVALPLCPLVCASVSRWRWRAIAPRMQHVPHHGSMKGRLCLGVGDLRANHLVKVFGLPHAVLRCEPYD